jgi:hypothetical protein
MLLRLVTPHPHAGNLGEKIPGNNSVRGHHNGGKQTECYLQALAQAHAHALPNYPVRHNAENHSYMQNPHFKRVNCSKQQKWNILQETKSVCMKSRVKTVVPELFRVTAPRFHKLILSAPHPTP